MGDISQLTFRFDITVEPCKVTQLELGVIPERIEYTIGNIQKTVPYSFIQYPCAYGASYAITRSDGTTAPGFIE